MKEVIKCFYCNEDIDNNNWILDKQDVQPRCFNCMLDVNDSEEDQLTQLKLLKEFKKMGLL